MRKRPILSTRLLEAKITIYKYLSERKRPYLVKVESLFPDSTKEDHVLLYYESLHQAIITYHKQVDEHVRILEKNNEE